VSFLFGFFHQDVLRARNLIFPKSLDRYWISFKVILQLINSEKSIWNVLAIKSISAFTGMILLVKLEISTGVTISFLL
jgi:hypothetical protein